MTRKDLYDVAFRYKKAGLWKKLWDNDVFALKLKNGETGYISVMGHAGNFCAMGLYIGDGFRSYRVLADQGEPTGSAFKDHESLLLQDSLQLALENKEYLMPEEVEEVREYAGQNGIKLGGKNAFPQFIKYEPYYHPWKVKNKADMETLYEAAQACVLIAECLKTATPEDLGIKGINENTKKVPLFSVEDGALKREGYAELPEKQETVYEPVSAGNELATAKVKRLPKNGVKEAELVRIPEPIQNSHDETPYYPMCFLMVDAEDGRILPVSMIMDYEKHPERMLNEIADAMVTEETAPKVIKCRDDRTYALLKDFCGKTGIKTVIFKGKMEALDDAEEQLYARMTSKDTEEVIDSMLEIIDMLLAMPAEELQKMPKPLLEQLRTMMEQGVFPERVENELRSKIKGL